MPSPKDAQNSNTKKSPAAKEGVLGQSLAKKRSQDFNTKIAGWNVTGAGLATEEDGAAIGTESASDRDDAVRGKGRDPKVRAKAKQEKGGETEHEKENVTPPTPKTPKTPETGAKPAAKQIPAWKASREVDPTKKAWVRRRSKPLQDGTPEASPIASPNVKSAFIPAGRPKTSPKTKPSDSAEPEEQLKSTEKSKHSPKPIQNDSKQTLEVATPKKRVVSDGHWRKDRLSKDYGQTPTRKTTQSDTNLLKDQEKDTTPKPRIVRRSVVSVGMKYPPSVQEFKEEAEQRPARLRPVKRRSQPGRGLDDGNYEREAMPDFETSSVKIYVKKRPKSGGPEHDAKDRKVFNTSESSFTVPSSGDRGGSVTDITTPDPAPTRERASRIRTEPRAKTNRSPMEDAGTRNRTDKSHSDAEASPRRVSHKKEAGAEKTPQTPIPKVFGNRIEGWLANMPDDPFVEPLHAQEATFDPQSVPRKASRSAENLANKDDSDYPRTSARRRRSKRNDDLDRSRESLPVENASPRTIDSWLHGANQTVRRRSLKPDTYTSVKDRVAQYTARDDGSMAPTDPPRRSSRRDTYAEMRALPLPATENRLPTRASIEGLRHGKHVSNRHHHKSGESILSRASDGDEPTRNGTLVRRKTKRHADLMSVLSLDRDDEYEAVRRRSTRSKHRRKDAPNVAALMNEVSVEELKYQRELRTLVDGVIPVLLQYVASQDRSSTSKATLQTQPIVEMGVALERLKASHKRIPMHDPKEILLWAENTAKVYADYLKVWRLGFNDIVVNLAPAQKDELPGWDNGLQRNERGDLLDGQGERVDVAYLLKRPLVRIKNLAKTFKGIGLAQRSALASDMVVVYDELAIEAKQRNNDERARLEDEAASTIDPSRARDLRSLAPLKGVNIDPTRRVRARDFFDLELFHSSGQQLGCRVEIVIREGADERSTSGDILICEVSEADGRWLLFPPVLTSNVSARKGDKDGEVVAMIRGSLSGGIEWRELISLKSSETQGAEWIDMLGSAPMPPRLTRQSSFNALRGSRALRDTAASPSESEIPIGEQARPTAPQWDGSDVNSVLSFDETSTPPLERTPRFALPIVNESIEPEQNDHHDRFDKQQTGKNPRHLRSRSEWIRPTQTTDHGVSMSYSDQEESVYLGIEDPDDRPVRRPAVRRRTSSVPGTELPAMNKLRNALKFDRSGKQPETQGTEWTPDESSTEPTSAPSKLQRHPLPPSPEGPVDQRSASHDAKTVSKSGIGTIPSFTPAFLKRHRRASSPLKHEYEPSTASESPSISDLSDDDDDDKKSLTSESSADEQVSTLGDLKDFSRICPPRATTRTLPPPPSPDTVGPSDSASQAPYRKVPPTNEEGVKSVANIFCWTDGGAWQSMHPEECEMIVTPGLIEAFDLSQAHAAMSKAADGSTGSPSAHGVKPLVALELTPWVPLRRGTAVDISIRGVPSSNSVLRNGNNIMFRSRSPEDCEKLYNLINRARIDNPTWIALQNARGPVPTSNWAEVMDRRNTERTQRDSSSWLKALSRKGTSYRSKGTRSASIAGTQTSAGSLHSTFSAIRQFSGSSRIFNIAKSTIMSKQSTRSSYSDSLSSGAATPLPIDASMGTPVGITNAKTRLYLRESTTKWKDLGNGHLTVVLPPRPDPSQPVNPRTTGLEKRVIVCGKKDGNTLLDVTLNENCFERIARTGIAVSVWQEGRGPNGELGHAAATGGVISSKSTVYMLQMKSERDAAYTFSMVGKLRY